jgi:antitoxin (DNA-binding transcriptional repressor) of toxin-antitoxin stability system
MRSLTDFVNLKIKSAQSFGGTHRGRVCVRIVRAHRRDNQTWLPARSVHSAHRALNHNDSVTGDRADG